MVEIIRAPKVSGRRRQLPIANGHSKDETTADSRTPSPASAEKAGNLNGSPAKSADERDRRAKRDQAHKAALEKANSRADIAEERAALLEREIERRFGDAETSGFEQGHRKGAEEAKREIEKDVAARLKSLDELCSSLRTEFSQNLNNAVQDTVTEVVFAAVTKLVGDAACDQKSVAAMVEQMTRHAESKHVVRVRVSPGDFDMLQEQEWVPSRGNAGPAFELAPDEQIRLGGCIIETSHGELDARLETQLRRLKDVLVEARANHAPEENA